MVLISYHNHSILITEWCFHLVLCLSENLITFDRSFIIINYQYWVSHDTTDSSSVITLSCSTKPPHLTLLLRVTISISDKFMINRTIQVDTLSNIIKFCCKYSFNDVPIKIRKLSYRFFIFSFTVHWLFGCWFIISNAN